MKKLLGLATALCFLGLLAAPPAFAGEAAGCGLGYMIFKGQKGMVPNVLAAITNGIFSNNAFGITSGTSGCNADSTVQRDQEQEVFVAVNLDHLSQDMAQGHGAYLDSLAGLMGCPTDVAADFSRMTQERYETLLPSADVQPTELLSALKAEMTARPALANACTRIS